MTSHWVVLLQFQPTTRRGWGGVGAHVHVDIWILIQINISNCSALNSSFVCKADAPNWISRPRYSFSVFPGQWLRRTSPVNRFLGLCWPKVRWNSMVRNWESIRRNSNWPFNFGDNWKRTEWVTEWVSLFKHSPVILQQILHRDSVSCLSFRWY